MPLFLVQDADRPLYVIARDYGEAEKMWVSQIALENDLSIEEVDAPMGINHIAEDDEFIGKPI